MKNTGLPIMGKDLAAFGVYSVTSCRKTVNASRIVIRKAIFSPESGGNQKTSEAFFVYIFKKSELFKRFILYVLLT